MRSTSAVIALLSSMAAAAPAILQSRDSGLGKPMNVTSVEVIDEGTEGNTTLSFDVSDLDSIAPAVAHCNATWPSGSDDYPHDSYVRCNDTSFGWTFQTYNNDINFILGITHTFEDPAVGNPDVVTEFARANLTDIVFACEVFNARSDCRPYPDEPIPAPVYALTA